jgi:dihydrolipoamide dehydrogenase
MEEGMTKEVYDVIVLGGGAGGVPAAIRAAQLGGKVAIIEHGNLGGFCMNQGCVPFGHMMAASGILGSLSLAKEMGLHIPPVSRDYGALIKRQNELIAFMRQGVLGMLKKNKVDLVEGRGKVAGKGRVEVNGDALRCRSIILASGAGWLKRDFPGADLKGVINSDELLNMPELPKKILLYGKSPWLIEIAQFLHNFDSETILATEEKSILPHENKTIRTRLSKTLKDQGIKILTGAEITGLKTGKDGLHAVLSRKGKQERLVVDRVMGLRRKASLNGLGLDTVGLDEKGAFLKVDDRMATGAEGVFAIGDITAPEKGHYSHLASSGGIVAAENAMGMQTLFDHRTIARVLFTQPQVACVGLTGRDAKKAGYDVITGAAPLSMNPFGMLTAQNNGIVEIVAEKKYGEILGIHIIGEGACDMAGQAVLAIQMEATLEELTKAVFPHPTLSESLVEAARECLGRSIFLP